jgi:hypothetical protein
MSRPPRTPASIARAAGVAAALVAFGSCAPIDRPSWRDQLVPDSPCYRVDLLDGLDDSDTVEVQDLFGCLNHQGHLESLAPTAAALEARDRTGRPAGLSVARAFNELPDVGASPAALLSTATRLLDDPADPLDGLLDIGIELTTGAPAPLVYAGAADPHDPDVLATGAVAPLGPTLSAIAGATLDQDLAPTRRLGEALAGDHGAALVETVAALARSPHPAVQDVGEALVPDVGDWLGATRTPGNELWDRSSGDSLADVARTLAGNGTSSGAMVALEGPAGAILTDDGARDRLLGTLRALEAQGVLEDVPSDLRWLARTDVEGGAATPGELSGLEAFARLVDAGNRDVVCSINLGLGTLDVRLGNLSVILLERFAHSDPDTLRSGAGLFGEIVGWSLSQTLLETIANNGVCPALTPKVVTDLQAFDLLLEPESRALVVTFMAVLRDLDDEGRVPDFVDTISAAWRSDLVWALGELARDTGDEPLWATGIATLPILDQPVVHGLPVDAPDPTWLWDGARFLLAEGGWDELGPVAAAAVRSDDLFDALAAAAPLLSDGDAESSRLLQRLAELADADPDGEIRQAVAGVLADDEAVGPILQVLETRDVAEALFAVEPVEGQEEVPLAFAVRLVTGGSLHELLSLFERLLRDVGGSR